MSSRSRRVGTPSSATTPPRRAGTLLGTALFGTALLALVQLLAAAGAAYAHAELTESEPTDGEVVAGTPETLTLTFDEPLGTDQSEVTVENAAGEELARGGIAADNSLVMVVELPPLPPGDYVAQWTAVTPDDGGVTRGEIRFTIEPPPAGTPGEPGDDGSPSPTPTRTGGGGLPLITIGPGATPRVTASPTARPSPTATAAPTERPTAAPSPAVSPSPSPAATRGGNDLLIALVLAAVIVGGLALYLLRR
jgi:methionine-rich copper-binding protein CopC